MKNYKKHPNSSETHQSQQLVNRNNEVRPNADPHRADLARPNANMRTKQPIRSKRDHFMYLDCLESDYIEPVTMIIKQKQASQALSKAKLVEILGHDPASPSHSPTSIFAPVSAPPPTMKLPEAVAKPSLPSASVWLAC